MENPLRPVVVFRGSNELEAQIARDVLTTAMIPILHLPSLSTGIFGVASSVRVAVPEHYAKQAIQAIQDAGLEASASSAPGGLAAFEDAVREKVIPLVGNPPRFSEKSSLRRVLIVLAIFIVTLVAITIYRS